MKARITINDFVCYEIECTVGVLYAFEAIQKLELNAKTIQTLDIEIWSKNAPKWKHCWYYSKRILHLLKNPAEYISPEERRKAFKEKQEKKRAERNSRIEAKRAKDPYWIKKKKKEARKEARIKHQKDNPSLYKDVVCKRCKGTGFVKFYAHVQGGMCFKCQGSGYVKVKVKSK
jgi:excinuclease UvrABC ATPase subunit